jgi:two-component system, OmpR family, KDP operon response regulator KdpE
MRVLVVDDEPQIRRALRAGLEGAGAGYTVALAATGEEGLDQAALHPPDVVILDLAMPGLDGLEVCRQLREWSEVPIIVLSVREGEEDKIAALDLGADDYLTKPFSLGELLARIRAVLRRQRGSESEAETPEIRFDDLLIDFTHRRVSRAGQELHLTPIEYDLLRQLALNADRVLTHRQLLTKVWGPEYAEDTHTLRVHIANLRAKMEPDPTRPRFIHTEPRIGYRFRTDG